jgi:nicotinamide-nucleotide amidase
MNGEIISIGTELLLGHIVDSNASWLANQLASLGINCYHISEVGDNLERVVIEMREALARSDFVVTTGGMGPTEDDVTREALAIVFGEELEIQKEAEVNLRNFFKIRNYEMPLNNLKQVKLIKSSRFLRNPLGTAPGIWAEKNNKIVVCLPGVPSEMKNIWQNQVLLNLKSTR